MQTLDWYYHRLTRMGAAEILWRVRGAAREAFDLIRLPLGAFPKLSSPAAWSQFSPGIVLRPSHTTLPSTRRAVLVAQAESILDNRLSYFQHNDLHLGQPMDWHRDWNQGLSSPLAMCPLVDYRVAHVSGDCKEVWEPNRHHQLVVLARAWHVTKDPRYADGVWAVLRSWLDANPFGHGMNWKSPLELGVRVINWIWALDLVRGHPCDESLWQRVHAAIHQHVWDLARKFSRGSSANNHLVGEAAGVFVATIWLPHLPKAMELRDLARQILIEEIEKQFHVDGGTREQALGYQFFSIQFFTICALLAQRSGNAMPAVYMQRLRAAYGYLAAFGEGGFDLPFYGDKDDGYVLDLGDGSHNVQAVPALASVLFEGKQVFYHQVFAFNPEKEGSRAAGDTELVDAPANERRHLLRGRDPLRAADRVHGGRIPGPALFRGAERFHVRLAPGVVHQERAFETHPTVHERGNRFVAQSVKTELGTAADGALFLPRAQ